MGIEHWDAGEAGCGALIAGLKRELERISGGQFLRITAHSAGARADLPAWCRITGHRLVEADHPIYLVCKRVE